MGNKFRHEAAFSIEEPAASFIPFSSHVTPNIVKLTSGDYAATIKLQGVAHESANLDDINGWHNCLNGWMRNIASANVAIWSHTVRRTAGEFPGGEFQPGFAHDLNEAYRARMASKQMLVNELYLTVVYRPQPIGAVKLLAKLFGPSHEEAAAQQAEEIERVKELVSTTLAALDQFDPELLGFYQHRGNTFSKVLEFYGFLVNGFWEKMPLPRGEISGMLASSRPFFGKGGLMSLKAPTENRFGSVVVVQEYPSPTYPGILNGLLNMPFEFVLSQSFTFISKASAAGRMQRQQARMSNAGDVAISQVEEISEALDDLVSNRFVLGTHSLGLLIYAENQKDLNAQISSAGAELADCGMKWAREDIGIAAAFWSMLPGNFKYRVRMGDITSLNFAGFAAMHNYPTGHIRGNQWGDALTMFETESGSPFYFSYHKSETGAAGQAAKLDPNHKALGNAVFIGQSGAGKTVLQMFLVAQAMKFNRPQDGADKRLSCVLFDKDLGASVGVRAMGGKYYPLKNGVPTGFQPLQLDDNPSNFSFLEQLIRVLVRHESMPITPRQEKEINDAIKGLMALPKAVRRFSSLLEFFDPTDEQGLRLRLAKWAEGGAFGWLLDNPSDTLEVDGFPILGFDITEFLDNEMTRTPTILYLFHRIESLLDGRRVPIMFDEFWKPLQDEAFQELFENKLVTIRKQNGLIVGFTQSPKQVLGVPIAHAIIGQTATKVFLPNPAADYDDYVNGFKVTPREYEIIKGLGANSRKFLVKQSGCSAVAKLDLKGFDDFLAVLSGNTATSNLAEKLVVELGDDPNVWLPVFQQRRHGG